MDPLAPRHAQADGRISGLTGGLVGADPSPMSGAQERPINPVTRRLGALKGRVPGPSLIVVAGIHGNEPGGVLASQRLMKRLQEESLLHSGDVTVLAGNVSALGSGKRFLERDLNRGWSEERLRALLQQPLDALTAEDREQRELCVAIDEARRQAHGPVIVVDLHTSSAPGLPFVLFSDTLAQRRFVAAFPIPVIIGLVEQVDGVLTEFFARRGCVTFCVEGGQHESDSSVDALEAVLWLSLAKAGMIDGRLDVVARAAQVLDEQRRGLPRVLEVLSRHSIVPEDGFVMEPGFKNIDVVSRGQRLARDVRGDICAPEDGVVVLPLYQKLGSDGFFWARAVHWPHMWAAAVLRTLRLDAMVGVLPGVERDADPNRVVVHAASSTTRTLLRLMGFRREYQVQGKTVWERTPDAR